MSEVRYGIEQHITGWLSHGQELESVYHFYWSDNQLYKKDLAGYHGGVTEYEVQDEYYDTYNDHRLKCPMAGIVDFIFRGSLGNKYGGTKRIFGLRDCSSVYGAWGTYRKEIDRGNSEYEDLPEWVFTEPHTAEFNLVDVPKTGMRYFIEEHRNIIEEELHKQNVVPQQGKRVIIKEGTILEPDTSEARKYQYALFCYNDFLSSGTLDLRIEG